ncbi:TetR/AcrR family transcriptional regulator [Pendulispora albinea]|uniref:TetR family transcriptional regulator n=1 Tax=Pendulispora albinea TaxID=2741071 RepID=A0ABZ2LWI9_9BACT
MSDKRTAILEATLRVIVRGGVNAVRYREVAAEAGVALGTISYQYPAREELIRSAFEHYLAKTMVSLRALADTIDIRKPEDLARLLVDAILVDFADPDKMYLVENELVLYAARDPALAEAYTAWDRSLVAQLGEIVERVGGTSPFSIAQTLLELTRGFSFAALIQKEPDFEDFKKRVTRIVSALFPAPETP